MNVTEIFLAKGTSVDNRLRGTNLVTKCGLPEGSCVIPNKSEYMDYETCMKVVKLVDPSNRKIRVRNVTFVLPIYNIYI